MPRGVPNKTASSEPESPTSEDTSSSEGYKLTIYYEPVFQDYFGKNIAASVVYRGIFTYNEEVLFDTREANESDHIATAKRYKFANEVKLGNIPPKVINLEED
jgi:hypothetical protein